MITLESMKQLGFVITWRLLSIAICDGQLPGEDVIQYAIERLESGDAQIEVCELAGTHPGNQDDICVLLDRLAAQETAKDDLERRKFRAAVVNEALKEKNKNCVDGLVSLTELWIHFGYPSDSPHVIQGRHNFVTPSAYYTEENYHSLYEKHVAWLKAEIEDLKRAQS